MLRVTLRVTSDPRRKSKFCLGLLCIALVLIAGLLQVTHSHQEGSPSHADCALCVTAHASVSPASLVVLPVALKHSTRVEVAPPPPSLRCFFTRCFYIRPPPVVPASI